MRRIGLVACLAAGLAAAFAGCGGTGSRPKTGPVTVVESNEQLPTSTAGATTDTGG